MLSLNKKIYPAINFKNIAFIMDHTPRRMMSEGQMGRTQWLVNKDEQQNYNFLDQGDRKILQSMKHDISMNGKYDPAAEKILEKYNDK